MERSVDIIDLFSPVTALKGVGPARARQLEKLGIFTLYDLQAVIQMFCIIHIHKFLLLTPHRNLLPG